MACDYQYYKDPNSYYPMLYCSIDNKRCLYSKRCELEKRFISLDNTKECYKYNMKKIKNIPEGSFYVVNKQEGFCHRQKPSCLFISHLPMKICFRFAVLSVGIVFFIQPERDTGKMK